MPSAPRGTSASPHGGCRRRRRRRRRCRRCRRRCRRRRRLLTLWFGRLCMEPFYFDSDSLAAVDASERRFSKDKTIQITPFHRLSETRSGKTKNRRRRQEQDMHKRASPSCLDSSSYSLVIGSSIRLASNVSQ